MNYQLPIITIFCDGGARGNPGPAAYGFVIKKDGRTIKSQGGFIGIATNNMAEYTAIVEALNCLKSVAPKQNLSFFVDSQLVASQLSGIFKIKNPTIREMVFKIRTLESGFGKITYTHIPREQNKEADLQVNIALDSVG